MHGEEEEEEWVDIINDGENNRVLGYDYDSLEDPNWDDDDRVEVHLIKLSENVGFLIYFLIYLSKKKIRREKKN